LTHSVQANSQRY